MTNSTVTTATKARRTGKIDRTHWPDILRRWERFERQAEIARDYGVSQTTISQTIRRARDAGIAPAPDPENHAPAEADASTDDPNSIETDEPGTISPVTDELTAPTFDSRGTFETETAPKTGATAVRPRATAEAERLCAAADAVIDAHTKRNSHALQTTAAELRAALTAAEAPHTAARKPTPTSRPTRSTPPDAKPMTAAAHTAPAARRPAPPRQDPPAPPSRSGTPKATPLPHGDAPSEKDAATGRVKFFRPDRGFGFIVPDHGNEDVFLGRDVVQAAGVSDLSEGDRVVFKPGPGKRGQEAKQIRILT